MASIIWGAKTAFKLSAIPSVTSPAPALNADMDVIAAAPVFPGEPAITSRWPVLPLWVSEGLGAKQALTRSGVMRYCLGATISAIWGGMPISTIQAFRSNPPPERRCGRFWQRQTSQWPWLGDMLRKSGRYPNSSPRGYRRQIPACPNR